MDITTPVDDVRALSRLLDAALDTGPADWNWNAWLDGLPAEQRRLAPDLRAMLASHRSCTQSGFLSELPALASDAPASPATVGSRLGPYRLLRELGRGGTGAVWLADRPGCLQAPPVAIKFAVEGCNGDLRACLRHEAGLLRRLDHPGLVPLLDADVDSARPYLVTAFVSGRSFDAWLASQDKDPIARLKPLLQLAGTVAHLHEQGIVHRDLKPSNILVAADGRPTLIDLGIAADAVAPWAADSWLGCSFTPGYAPPEQIGGGVPCPTTDVYALGVLMCEALAGRPLLAEVRRALRDAGGATADLRMAYLGQHLCAVLDGYAVSEALRALAQDALALDPGQRPASARQFGQRLALALGPSDR